MSVQETAQRAVGRARAAFQSGKTLDVAFRKKQLLALDRFLRDESEALLAALHADLHKCRFEGDGGEVSLPRSEIAFHLDNIDSWVTPKAAGNKGIAFALDTCVRDPQPRGVALIIGAWNYPIQLVLLPLIGAISAGCCAILKPSEVSSKSAAALQELERYLDSECFHVVNGGVDITTALLQQRFDHVFYTGGSAVGKIVMRAAAEHLTSVTLELGGKSPCVIDNNCDLNVVAKRILFGKFINAGQTCVAPDYVLCEKSVQPSLVDALRKAIEDSYTRDPKQSPDYGRIINRRHFDRVKKLIDPAKVKVGGQMDENELYIAPTVMTDVQPDDLAMEEEIFGPVLPILTVRDKAEAIEIINSREKPLVIYAFSSNKSFIEELQKKTSSGSFMVNDTLIFHLVPNLPFGGVGGSGMGAYHGYATFEAFSHMKTVMKRSLGMEFVNRLRYPPYTERNFNILKRVLMKEPKEGGHNGPLLTFTFVLAAFAILAKVLGFF